MKDVGANHLGVESGLVSPSIDTINTRSLSAINTNNIHPLNDASQMNSTKKKKVTRWLELIRNST